MRSIIHSGSDVLADLDRHGLDRHGLDRHGYAVLAELLDPRAVTALLEAIGDLPASTGVRKRSNIYAVRNLLTLAPTVADVANSVGMSGIARAVLGDQAAVVKATLFDKTPDANWLVPWHQDLTICVNERIDLDGYGPWSIKAGVVNVQPPVWVLENMLAVRIHLDDCDEQNGALRVLPGTHRRGRMRAEQIAEAESEILPVTCTAPRGGAVLMRPLLLHASSPSAFDLPARVGVRGSEAGSRPKHRRVVHLEYGGVELPAGFSWRTELRA